MKAIQTESLTKIYHRRQIALNGVNLEVERGTVLGVVGQNGAGKTTLVKLMLGLHRPTAGRVFLLDRPMTPNNAALRRRLGYLPADPRFPAGSTPIGYLNFVARLCGMTHKDRQTRLAHLLRAVELLPVAGEPISVFSTGMRARLAIAASLINDPEILIWDEPAQGLDPEARRTMLDLVKGLATAKTLVICSHHLPDVLEICARVLILHEGQVVFLGAAEELKSALRPNQVELQLAGDRKDLTEALKGLQDLKELANSVLQKNILRIEFAPEGSRAAALASVLMTLVDHRLELLDLRLAGEPTEQVIAKLLRKEGSRGLTRAYQAVAS